MKANIIQVIPEAQVSAPVSTLREAVQNLDNSFANTDFSLYVYREEVLKKSIRYFKNSLNANILYAVKANNSANVIETMLSEGVSRYDVSSLEEIELILSHNKDAEIFFMNPVKSRFMIRKAYELGVRHFVLDHHCEFEKITDELQGVTDLTLHLRLHVSGEESMINLSEKYGAKRHEAIDLLHKISKFAQHAGVSFHVGSQCMDPEKFCQAIDLSVDVIKSSGVSITYLNIGGGFPSIYPGLVPSELNVYFSRINEKLKDLPKNWNILCEPGRALVAESTSLIVKVMLRKGNTLYINDGVYGSLFDAGILKLRYPVRLVSEDETKDNVIMTEFDFFGPTCDSLDYMPGPFLLPDSIQEGDYIEIGQLGAYSKVLSTQFNGFSSDKQVVHISDPPIMSLYGFE